MLPAAVSDSALETSVAGIVEQDPVAGQRVSLNEGGNAAQNAVLVVNLISSYAVNAISFLLPLSDTIEVSLRNLEVTECMCSSLLAIASTMQSGVRKSISATHMGTISLLSFTNRDNPTW